MLSFQVVVLYCLILRINTKNVEIQNPCVDNIDVFWNSLNFWKGDHLFRKLKMQDIENLSETCGGELKEVIESANNGSIWAIRMFDASGHYEGGIFNGNEFNLGANTQCQEMEQIKNKKSSNVSSIIEDQFYRRTSENRYVINDDYSTKFIPPFSVKFAVATLIFKMNSFCQFSNEIERVLQVGLCLPSSCGAPDVRTTLEWAVRKDVIDVMGVRFIPGEHSVWEDSRFYFLCALFFTITLLITLGTVLEYININHGKKFGSCWYKVLQAFSVIGNMKSICSLEVGDDILAPIHGLKFISMMWVVLGHTCLLLFVVSGNKKFREKSETNFLYQSISSSTYSVNTFFTISGILVSFLFFRTVDKYSIKKLVLVDGALGHIVLYIGMVAYRLVRLSLPYFIMIVLSGFLSEQKYNNVPLLVPSNDHSNCAKYWWRNVLYVNTFYPTKQMCMVWSWYLAADTQLFVLGVILLLVALRFRILSLILGSVILVISWITTGIISYYTQHVIDVSDPFANYDALYDKPWIRVGPYFIGMATGWYLFNIKRTLKVPQRLNVLLWVCAVLSMIFIVYGPMYFQMNPIFGIVYTSLSHSIWSAAIAWVAIACVTENGWLVNNILSWKYMYPFSRLSYCVYLVHPVVIRTVLMSSESAYFISIEIMAALYFGFLCLSLIFAALLSLAFESPVVALLRLGRPMIQSKK